MCFEKTALGFGNNGICMLVIWLQCEHCWRHFPFCLVAVKKKVSLYQCSKLSNRKDLMAQWQALMINYQSPLCTCVPYSS